MILTQKQSTVTQEDVVLSSHFHFHLGDAQKLIDGVELHANLWFLNRIVDFLGHQS